MTTMEKLQPGTLRLSKKIFLLQTHADEREIVEKELPNFVESHNIELYFFTDSNHVFLQSSNRVELRNGIVSFQNLMGLRKEVKEIAPKERKIYIKIKQAFGIVKESQDLPVFLCSNISRGEFFDKINDQKKKHGVAEANKRMKETLINGNLEEMMDEGELDMQTFSKQKLNYQASMASIEQQKKLQLPELKGTITWTHTHYIENKETKKWQPNPEAPVIEVSFTGTDDLEAKKKHLWIYSKKPSWGKSTTIRKEILEKYNSDVIQDVDNTVNTTVGVKIIVIEEYSPTKKVGIADFKAMTGGTASMGKFNNKMYGSSYIPDKAAQFIILSNHCPAEVYACGRQRFIDTDTLDQLNDRFMVYRLDGCHKAETTKWVDPASLNHKDLMVHIKMKTEELKRDATRSITFFFTTVVTIHDILMMSKYKRSGITIKEFAEILTECVPIDHIAEFPWIKIVRQLSMESEEFVFNNTKSPKFVRTARTKIADLMTAEQNLVKKPERELSKLEANLQEVFRLATCSDVNKAELDQAAATLFKDPDNIYWLMKRGENMLSPSLKEVLVVESKKRSMSDDSDDEDEEDEDSPVKKMKQDIEDCG